MPVGRLNPGLQGVAGTSSSWKAVDKLIELSAPDPPQAVREPGLPVPDTG